MYNFYFFSLQDDFQANRSAGIVIKRRLAIGLLSNFLRNGPVVAEIGMIEGGPPPSEAF